MVETISGCQLNVTLGKFPHEFASLCPLLNIFLHNHSALKGCIDLQSNCTFEQGFESFLYIIEICIFGKLNRYKIFW